jgi:hypothetical protein
MRRRFVLFAVLALVVTACGGDDGGATDGASGGESSGSDSGQSDGGDAASSGNVVNVQAAGEAHVSVDGKEFTLTGGPSLDCNIGPEVITFAFWVGDNSTTLGGGANLYDDGWLGDIRLSTVDDEGLPLSYYPDDGAMNSGIAISGDSMSFSGPMLMQPPNDGTNPPPVSVGSGTISATCG